MESDGFLACVVGSSIICVDLITRYIPGKRNFRIQDSNVFLSSSLSLSFGVMVSLVDMKMESTNCSGGSYSRPCTAFYLRRRSTSPKAACLLKQRLMLPLDVSLVVL